MLGVSAVPGAGKTHTLSALAARILSGGSLRRDQEVLIVTLVNSAVNNFNLRISAVVGTRGLIPNFGYRVRTLHGLAHDIVRENPAQVGLDKKFTIVDESASGALLAEAARAWAGAHPEVRDAYLRQDLPQATLRRNEEKEWPALVESVAAAFIRSAKDRGLTPPALGEMLRRQPTRLPLAQMCSEIYQEYQEGLAYRGAVDFDDLIRFAANLLQESDELVERLRFRWPYILEDEAQDSSELQQTILSTLAGSGGNWVRVGDPNQAIFETFTTANPMLLREFIREHDSIPMPESGRCQPSIIELANHLVDWARYTHPIAEIRDALDIPPIEPAPSGDPQPNPPDDPRAIQFVSQGFTPAAECEAIAKSVQGWLPGHSDWTVAVLAMTNTHATNIVNTLQRRGIPCLELLRSTSTTRAVAGSLHRVLQFLSEPTSPRHLSRAYGVWRRDWRAIPERRALLAAVSGRLGRLEHLEDFVAGVASVNESAPARDLSAPDSAPALSTEADELALQDELDRFAVVVARWLTATALPPEQLLLLLAQEIFTEAADLALAHKLALVLGQLADENRDWRLPELTPNLNQIARNERKFLGFSADDSGFDPSQHQGRVVVSTMHKAKGLEWDRVYLASLNNYDFPAGQPGDRYVAEKWYMRGGLNLEAEALAQLDAAVSQSEYQTYVEGDRTAGSRLETARERLRLLYVGITRARRDLVLTWNTGKRGDLRPALAFEELRTWWEQCHPDVPAPL